MPGERKDRSIETEAYATSLALDRACAQQSSSYREGADSSEHQRHVDEGSTARDTSSVHLASGELADDNGEI